MRRTVLLSAGLLVVAACASPTRPAPPPTPNPPSAPPPPPPRVLAVDLTGDYTLTFEVGGGCEEVPKELRIRSYEARISSSDLFGYWFLADLSGAKFHDGQRSVGIEVGADFVGVDLSDNIIIEEPSPGTYFATSGYGVASLQSSELSTISGPYTGYFKYCAATSGTGGTDQCSVVTMAYDMCKAENSRWTLTRR